MAKLEKVQFLAELKYTLLNPSDDAPSLDNHFESKNKKKFTIEKVHNQKLHYQKSSLSKGQKIENRTKKKNVKIGRKSKKKLHRKG